MAMNDVELSELQASRNRRRRRYRINLSRHVYNEQEFTESFIKHEEYSSSAEFERPSFANSLKRYFCRTKCTPYDVLNSWFPIVEWLPGYNVRRDLAHDLAGGLTVAIMHIPQGLAYAMLASLPAVTGLYTAFVPLLVYMAMGTSRHLSLGTFAVVCLMVGSVVEREVANSNPSTTVAPTQSSPPSDLSTSDSTWEGLIFMEKSNSSSPSTEDLLNEKKLEVAVALSMLVGLFQFVMGLLKLGFVAVYLSDPIISGFTTGAAILVFTSQIKHILGLNVPRYAGAFAVVKSYIYMFKNIKLSVPGAILTGVICILLLFGLKFISEKLKHKMKFPIPAELITVVLGTVLSYYIGLNENFQVEILGDIPRGLRMPSPPSFLLMGSLITDAMVIAIVIFATNVSLAKTFAKRNNYVIDSNQELIACGSANILGSFFSCFPVSGSLSRSVIQEGIGRTQLCSIPVVVIIILVLLFIAPLFYHLPKAILAAIVVVALKGLFKQFGRLVKLWKICKPDAMVWFATWLGVVLLGIDIGLGVGVMSALLVVLFKSSRPPVTLLGQIPRTGIYRDVQRVPAAKSIPGVKIFRFESALFYANVEFFRSALIELTGIDPQYPYVNSSLDFVNHSSPQPGSPSIEIGGGFESATIAVNKCVENGNIEETSSESENIDNVVGDNSTPVHAIIVDASTFNFIDTQGVNALVQLGLEFEKIGVKFYLAHCRYYVRELLEKAGFTAKIGSEHLFVSVHDAVVHAVGMRSEVESCASPVMSDTESVTAPIESTVTHF